MLPVLSVSAFKKGVEGVCNQWKSRKRCVWLQSLDWGKRRASSFLIYVPRHQIVVCGHRLVLILWWWWGCVAPHVSLTPSFLLFSYLIPDAWCRRQMVVGINRHQISSRIIIIRPAAVHASSPLQLISDPERKGCKERRGSPEQVLLFPHPSFWYSIRTHKYHPFSESLLLLIKSTSLRSRINGNGFHCLKQIGVSFFNLLLM